MRQRPKRATPQWLLVVGILPSSELLWRKEDTLLRLVDIAAAQIHQVKDVLNTNEKPTSSHHAENPCNIFHSMIPQSWQISQFLHPCQPSFTACSTKVIRLLGSLGQRAARFERAQQQLNSLKSFFKKYIYIDR